MSGTLLSIADQAAAKLMGHNTLLTSTACLLPDNPFGRFARFAGAKNRQLRLFGRSLRTW